MYGDALKSIRKSKNLTQTQVAATQFSQAMYSYYEKNQTDIAASHFIHVLSQLQVSLDELKFIANHYQYSDAEHLSQRFFSQPFNNEADLSTMIQTIEAYLTKHNDHVILEELKYVCEALLILISSGNIDEARTKVEPIWRRLSNFDHYYVMDIKMVNAILYLFPYETAQAITQILLKSLERYGHFHETKRLKVSVKLNFSLMSIMEGHLLLAQEMLECVLASERQDMSYISLAVCFNRLAICYSFQAPELVASFAEKRRMLLTVYEDTQLDYQLRHEFKTYACSDYQ